MSDTKWLWIFTLLAATGILLQYAPMVAVLPGIGCVILWLNGRN